MIKIYIYKIENKITNMKYIGSTKNYKKRINGHFKSLRKNKHINDKLQEDYNLYGEDSFIYNIIYECFVNDDSDKLIVEESITNQYSPLYNLRIGPKTTEELKNIISQETKKAITDDTRNKLSVSTKKRFENKENHPCYGKHRSKETIDKIRKSNTGKTHTEEAKKKMSIAQTGEGNGFYGKHHTEEARKKMIKPISEEMEKLILYFYYELQFSYNKISVLTGYYPARIKRIILRAQC